MNRAFTICLLFTSIISVLGTPAVAQNKVQANDLVDVFEKLSGKHPGFRKAHARGLCATGTFSPNATEEFADAKLLTSGDLPVAMRFSLGGGDPNADERAPGTRGAAVRLTLPDGSFHVFTGNNFPVFLGKDPDTFHGFLSTLLPDENGNQDPAKTGAFVAANPSLLPNLAWQKQAQTPASYANTEFFGLHTFYYDVAQGEKTKFRWHLTPDLGVKTLSKEEAQTKSADFLVPTMQQQMQDQSVSYTLHAWIGQPEDSVSDPSQQWPQDRPKVVLGTITIKAVGGDACDMINFDPNMLSAGFSPSDDPVLKMRSAAYAISFAKRVSNQ